MTISTARSRTQSGTVSRTGMPVRDWMRGGETFDVLHIDGAEDIDVGVEEEEDVFVGAWCCGCR